MPLWTARWTASGPPEPLAFLFAIGFEDWTPWNGCSVSCGEGTQDRSREEALSAEFGGAACNGSSREWKACDLELCPKDRRPKA